MRWVYRNASTPVQVLIAASSSSPSTRAALLAPALHLGGTSVAVVSEVPLTTALAGWTESVSPWRHLMDDAGAVMGDGHFLQHGHDVWSEAVARRIPYFVSQHGALTPYAPPLPPGTTHLSWTERDGDFWRSGRHDVTVEVIGSQLLWEAEKAAPSASTHRPGRTSLTYLGQGHAAEIPRRRLVEAAVRFCRANDATYRPHPQERDRLSRLVHGAYLRVGMTVDGSVPLSQLPGAVVSVFSTGVLEAAAQGRDAWVDLPRPPAWLDEFWERYGMSRFGRAPTSPLPPPDGEPARRIAEILTGVAS